MKHLSVRVPWHDHYWDGTFCQHPSCNTFCQALPKIAMAKSDAEDARACQAWGTLQQDQRPACAGENGGFMCDKPHTRVFRHVYARPGNRHAALLPTPVNIPPYAAQGVPFRYMSKDYQPTLSERHPEFSDDEEAPFTSSWIYGEHRQHDILSWFRSQVATHESLCVFYCKHGTPVDDDYQRLIVGLGEVTKVHPLLEYESTQDFTYRLGRRRYHPLGTLGVARRTGVPRGMGKETGFLPTTGLCGGRNALHHARPSAWGFHHSGRAGRD